MSHRLFLYGTLCDAALYEAVAGVPLEGQPASMPGARVHWVAGENFPVLVEGEGTADGVIVEVGDETRDRMDFYELGFGYGIESRIVLTPNGQEEVLVYLPEPSRWPEGAAWSLAAWQAEHGELARTAAQDYMALMGTLGTEEAARAFPQIRMRAASRLRAAREPSPEIAPEMAHRSVTPERTAIPYTDYFSVREDWLAFPHFGGGTSPLVKRATFMGGDAVTILPYDPVADTVLVVRQFRHGPFCRGDTNPWTLEPAAGRIDPGETPEDAAHRELAEETGVTGGALHLVGRYYPSPGAFSEYLWSYVAIAELSGRDREVGGVDDEAEDIMAHVLPFADAMEMVGTGAVNTGPLILSLGWLALNRDRLRLQT